MQGRSWRRRNQLSTAALSAAEAVADTTAPDGYAAETDVDAAQYVPQDEFADDVQDSAAEAPQESTNDAADDFAAARPRRRGARYWPPTIIDRYVLREFVRVFVICFLSLAGLYIVFDAFANLDEFMRYSERHGSLLGSMGEYYFYRSIFFFDRTSGILTLIAAMFTVVWLRRYNEWVALLAAGIPGRRVMGPVLGGALLIAVGAAVSREFVIPAIRPQLSRDPKDLLGENAKSLPPQYDNETDILMRGRQTYAANSRIHQPSFGLPLALEAFGKQLVAADAYYKPAEGKRPAGYLLTGVTEPDNLAELASGVVDGRRVLITPRDEPSLKPGECFVVSNVNFEQLTGGRAWRQFSSTRELVQGLQNPSLDFRADVRVAIHMRFLQPVMDMTLLLLGLPLVLTRENRNMFVSVGQCMGIVGLYVLMVLVCQRMGSSYFINPALAAWLPLMVFGPLAAGMSDVLRE